MRFLVRIADGGGEFEIERGKAPDEGDFLSQGTVGYEVTAVLPGERGFDHIVEAVRRIGPAHVEHEP